MKLISLVFLSLGIFYQSVLAEEVTVPQQTKDWAKAHRQAYQQFTLTKSGPEMIAALPSVPTFVRAANHNIEATLAEEYRTVFERNALYDLVSLVLEHEPLTKKGVKDVKFFHAATVVTARVPLGIVDLFEDAFCAELTEDVRKFLREVNAELLALNMPVIKKTLFEWDHPKHPSNGSDEKISAWEFDLAMVDFEQNKVEEIITNAALDKTTKSNINAVSAGCNWAGEKVLRFTLVGAVQKWLKNVGYAPFDFFNIEHRKATGKAIVTVFHKKTEADFRKAIGK